MQRRLERPLVSEAQTPDVEQLNWAEEDQFSIQFNEL